MRNAIIITSAALTFACSAVPFVTPSMTKRNGLTDKQYELLWAQGKSPRIDVSAARDWVFRASRFQNVTNWLDECGVSNDFAKLSYKLQGDNFELDCTNKFLYATNGVLTRTCVRLAEEVEWCWNGYTNQLAETAAYSNMYVIASGIAASATAKIQDEIADLQAKIVKYEEYKTKYPLLKSVWNALIADAQNRIKVLEALTTEK